MDQTDRRTELLEGLMSETEQLQFGDHVALDALQQRLRMLVRRVFGLNSPYLSAFNRISFSAMFSSASSELELGCWSSGKAETINLIETMLEELREFECIPAPVLAIHDTDLQSRTSDLLAAPGNYDRVLREATTILEDRIRHKIPFEDLTKIIPNATEQMGDKLVTKLFSPGNPVLVFGDPTEQVRLCQILRGTVAYLRNPAHHSIDDDTKWSWAWSVVGLVDQLLDDVGSCKYERPAGL